MANNPKKIDPTEAALSAIQEALEVRDGTTRKDNPASLNAWPEVPSPAPEPLAPTQAERRAAARAERQRERAATTGNKTAEKPRNLAEDDELFLDQPARGSRGEEPVFRRPAANDDRQSIGQILQAVQRRPSRMSYTVATIFTVAWLVAGVGIGYLLLPQLQAMIAQAGAVAIPMLFGLGALFLAPVFFFYALAHMVTRSQELRLIAQSMAEVAIRLAEPESVARESIVSVGQAIRREVAAMGDGVERALARAAELEALVHNEVSALERAYNDNEVRIRGMLQDLASQRDTLVTQAEQVRNAITSVHLDLSQDITAVSDLVAERVGETAQRITHTLADKGEHITLALGRAGDSMITALTERGGDMLERLEMTSEQTTHAINTANERMTASLNFKTDSINEEFIGLANTLKLAVSSQLDDVAREFERRSADMAEMVGSRSRQLTDAFIENSAHIADTISSRAEEANATLKATGDSLILDLSMRGGDVVSNLEQVGKSITDTLMTRGVDVVSNIEEVGTRINDTLTNHGGNVVTNMEQVGRRITDALTGRGDDVVVNLEQVGQRVTDALTNHSGNVIVNLEQVGQQVTGALAGHSGNIVSNLEEISARINEALVSRSSEVTESFRETGEDLARVVDSKGEAVKNMLAARLLAFEEMFSLGGAELGEKITRESTTLGNLITRHLSEFDRTVKTYGGELVERLARRNDEVTQALDSRSQSLDLSLASRVAEIANLVDSRVSEITGAIDSRVSHITTSLDSGVSLITTSLDNRAEEITTSVDGLVTQLTTSIDGQVLQITRSIGGQVSQLTTTIDGQVAQITDAIGGQVSQLTTTIDGQVSQLTGTIDGRVSDITATIDSRVSRLTDAIGGQVAQLTSAIGGQVSQLTTTIDGRVADITTTIDGRVSDITATIDSRVSEITSSIDSRVAEFSHVVESRGNTVAATLVSKIADIDRTLDSRATQVAASLEQRIGEIDRTLGSRALEVADNLDNSISRIEHLSTSIQSHTGEAERKLTDLSINISNTLKQNVHDVERTLLGVSEEVARAFISRADEISASVSARATEMTTVLDQSSTGLLSALTNKSEEFANQVGRATDHALSEIEVKGFAFTRSLADQSGEITRGINEASVNATAAVTRTLQELQEASQIAIEQSKQTATATVSEMLETHGMLRSDTTTLFERLREANILLQEVLTGAHENMSSLENTLVSRVSDFVASMNKIGEESGAATLKVDEQIGKFSNVTARVLGELGQLATKFDAHGRGLAEAVELIDNSNRRTELALSDRRNGLDQLVAALDLRTEDLEERLKRLTGLLDETLESASSRAHDIAQVVSEASTGGAKAISEQFNLVRSTVEAERQRTAEAMRGIYEDARNDTGAIFRQSTERFTEVIHGMKHMASEMQRELESTRVELRRGILELPQETAESAAQMRRVIVDQIDALAELNRIVARHGRGLETNAETVRRNGTNNRDESTAGGYERERMDAPREPVRERIEPVRERIEPVRERIEPARERLETMRERIEPVRMEPRTPARRELPAVSMNPASSQGPVRRTMDPSPAPSLNPAGSGNRASGWLSDLLQRASRDEERPLEIPREREPVAREPAKDERNARHSIESLDSLSVDIARMIDHEAAAELWDRYKRGERNVFTRRLYTLQGQKAFDDISKKYRTDREFRQTVDRYITEFERLLDEVSRDDRGQVVARTYLTSETGKVYTMLAHAAGRFE